MAKPEEPRQKARSNAGVLGTLNAIDKGIAKVETLILAYAVILMAINSIANVIGRFVIGQSIYFSPELNQFLIVLVTFVGLAYATRQGRHIRMSAFYDQLSDRGRKVLMIIIALVTGTVMFVLAYYSYLYVDRVARLGKVTPALQVPLYLTYIWVPIGFVVTGIQYFLTVYKNLREPDVYISFEHVDSYEDPEELMAGATGSAAIEESREEAEKEKRKQDEEDSR
jgi:TRAP-type C4-dicarboxylate transport system permease small subunit